MDFGHPGLGTGHLLWVGGGATKVEAGGKLYPSFTPTKKGGGGGDLIETN